MIKNKERKHSLVFRVSANLVQVWHFARSRFLSIEFLVLHGHPARELQGLLIHSILWCMIGKMISNVGLDISKDMHIDPKGLCRATSAFCYLVCHRDKISRLEMAIIYGIYDLRLHVVV